MLVVPSKSHFAYFVQVEPAFDVELVVGRKVIGVGERVRQVSQVELEMLHLPSLTHHCVQGSTLQGFFESPFERADSEQLLKPAVLGLIEIFGQSSASLVGCLYAEQKLSLYSLGLIVADLKFKDEVVELESCVVVEVGDVVGGDQLLVVEVLLEERLVVDVDFVHDQLLRAVVLELVVEQFQEPLLLVFGEGRLGVGDAEQLGEGEVVDHIRVPLQVPFDHLQFLAEPARVEEASGVGPARLVGVVGVLNLVVEPPLYFQGSHGDVDRINIQVLLGLLVVVVVDCRPEGGDV